MSIKEQIKTEIERLKKENGQYMASCVTLIVFKACAKDEAYDEVLSFIDSLPAEEKPSEDLEKYASRAGFDYVDDIVNKYPGHRWNDHDVEFAYRDGIIAGIQLQKEQMMEEAVEGEIAKSYSGRLVPSTPYSLDGNKYHFGDKVKIIIVKEDEK